MRALANVVLMCCVVVGCDGVAEPVTKKAPPAHPNVVFIAEVQRGLNEAQLSEKQRTPEDPTYILFERGRIVCFSSTPRVPDNNSTIEAERKYAEDLSVLLKVVQQWIEEHPNREVLSCSISERGGHTGSHGEAACYSARAVLLLKN